MIGTTKVLQLSFNEEDWFTTISKTRRMDTLITNHSKVMDKYDPEKKIGLIVDEWGIGMM